MAGRRWRADRGRLSGIGPARAAQAAALRRAQAAREGTRGTAALAAVRRRRRRSGIEWIYGRLGFGGYLKITW